MARAPGGCAVGPSRYMAAAKEGDAKAQFRMGCCYYEGIGCAKSLSEAAEWWRLAAEQGFVGSQVNLGDCFYHEEGDCPRLVRPHQ